MSQRDTSFSAVYDDHVGDVYGFFGYRVGSREEAEDLTQATFERALTAWERFEPARASPRTWLIAIAQNLLFDHYRRKGSRPREQLLFEDAVGVDAAGREPAVDEHLGVDPELASALALLGDRARTLIALRFGGDLTGREIAELTGLTVANVQQILSRSLRRLRAELEGSGPDGEGAIEAGRGACSRSRW